MIVNLIEFHDQIDRNFNGSMNFLFLEISNRFKQLKSVENIEIII